jgi:hypothetical protein
MNTEPTPTPAVAGPVELPVRPDPERATFETWAAVNGYSLKRCEANPSRYHAWVTNTLWIGWQAGTEKERERRKPLTGAQIDDMLADANRGYCIERDDYIKAVRDAERAHGLGLSMADGNIAAEVSTRAEQDELERLRTENAALNREAHTWSKAAEKYAADLERHKPLLKAVEWILEDGHMNQEHLTRLRAAWEGA